MKRTRQGVLHIGRPRIEHVDGMARVVAAVVHEPIPGVDGTGGDVWFAVKEEYGRYLCHERSDAFVVGMLFYSMRLGLDIACEAPVSEEILFKLRTYFIPSISKNCEEMYPCAIEAKPAGEPLPNAGAVGTGISCGVDSLHAVFQQTGSPSKGMNLTHLVLNNVGAYKPRSKQFIWQREHGRAFAKAYGLPFVETDSNICRTFVFNCRWFHFTNTYMNAFSALCLQKLWGTFTIASGGWSFAFFSLSKILVDDSAVYDLLFLHAISTRRLQFLSGGGGDAIREDGRPGGLAAGAEVASRLHGRFGSELRRLREVHSDADDAGRARQARRVQGRVRRRVLPREPSLLPEGRLLGVFSQRDCRDARPDRGGLAA